MRRKPTPVLVHQLTVAEQRVLASFLSGRLPAGQVHTELQRAQTAPAPSLEPEPAPVVQPLPVVAA